MKITLNFSVNVCIDDNRKYEINSDNEKIAQLLGLLADLGVSNLQKQSRKNITVKELLDLYASAKMLKNNSVLSIYSSFKQLIGHDNYLSMDISELSPSLIMTDCTKGSMNTKHHYLAQMSAVLNFAVKKGYLSVNFLKNFRDEYGIYKKKISMRKAFSCENWILIDDAVAALKPFFRAIHDCFVKYLNYSRISLYYLMLLHMILGTRVSETLRVVRNFIPEDGTSHYIYIETKTCKLGEKANFRVVLSDLVIYLINIVKPIAELKEGTNFWYAVRKSLKSQGVYSLSLHGTRAILRTVVDLLTETKSISYQAKEVYLSHDLRGKVERSYQRQDFFIERYKLQIEYAKFLVGTCCEDKELYNIVINDGYIEKIIDKFTSIN